MASHDAPAPTITATPAALGRRWSGLAATALDEALLSAISLAQAMVLVHAASKPDYGRFTLVVALLLLVRGVQNALVLTLLNTQGARRAGAERAGFVHTLARLQAWLGAALAAALAIGVAAYTGEPGLAAASGLALAGGWLREYRRGVALLDGDHRGALVGDAVFVALAAVGLVGLVVAGAVTATGVLASAGLAAGAAAWTSFPRLPGRGGEGGSPARPIAVEALRQGRWTLPGMAVTWGQNSGYVYLVGLVLDAAAVADLAAARLFIVPLLLASVAWGRVSLPRSASLSGEGRDRAVIAGCLRAGAWLAALAVAYAAALAAAFALGLGAVLPAAYAGVAPLVLGWCGFAAINLVRSIASTALVARLDFRALFGVSTAGAAASLLLVVALLGPLGAPGALVGLVAGELVLAGLAWRFLLAARRA